MLIVLALLAAGAPPRTFRVGYVHAGTASEERFALERLVLEPLPWPGNPGRPIDDTDSGRVHAQIEVFLRGLKKAEAISIACAAHFTSPVPMTRRSE